ACSPPVSWMRRSASVDLPWSIWATIEKLRMREIGVVMGRRFSRGRGRRQGGAEPGKAGRHAVGSDRTGDRTATGGCRGIAEFALCGRAPALAPDGSWTGTENGTPR